MLKKMITIIMAAAVATSLLTACTAAAGNNSAKSSGADLAGKVYTEQSFEGNTGQGIIAALVNSKGEFTVASQAENAPLKIAAYDASGKKVSELTTDVNEAAMYFTMNSKDQACVLTESGQLNVLDTAGKTIKKIPVKDIIQKNVPTFGGKSVEVKDEVNTNVDKNAEDVEKSDQASPSVQPSSKQTEKSSTFQSPQPSANQAAQPTTDQQQTSGEVAQSQIPNAMLLAGMVKGFAASSDGSIFLSLLGAGVLQIDSNGKVMRTYAGMMDDICLNEKEQLIVYSMGQGGRTLAVYDIQNGSQISKKDAVLNNSVKIFYDKTSKKLYYLNGDGIYPVKEDGTSGESIMKLTDISLDSTSRGLTGFAFDKTGSVYIASVDKNASGSMGFGMKDGNTVMASHSGAKADRIDKLALVDASSVPKKKILTIAGIKSNSILNAAISEFQKAHPDYKVDLKTYDNEIEGMKQSGQAVDFVPMIQRFNTDIISGNSADIFILDNLPLYKYIEKGVLADLQEMIKAEGMDMSAYYTNIIEACKVNGKLYSIPIAFTYNVLAGKASNMPLSATPTVEEFLQKAKALPAGLAALPKEDAVEAFLNYMEDNYRYYIDQNTHSAKFDSPEFIKALNDFKELADKKMSAVSSEDQDANEQIGDNKLAFMPVSISGADQLSIVKAMAGDDTVFAKMPAMQQDAYNFTANGLFGINAVSQNKQAAWDFIKILLSQGIQSNKLLNGFPINKAASASAIDQLKGMGAMGESGAAGNKEVSRMVVMTKNKQYEVKPLSDAEYDAVKATLEKLNKLSVPDPNVIKIFKEELPAFFSGQKNAQDVSSLIQNRISTILSE